MLEKQFLEECLKDYNNKSQKLAKGHEDIKIIFEKIENRINKLGDELNGKNKIKKIKD